MSRQVKQVKAPRKLSQEVKLVKRALQRIASHPVPEERMDAFWQIGHWCVDEPLKMAMKSYQKFHERKIQV